MRFLPVEVFLDGKLKRGSILQIEEKENKAIVRSNTRSWYAPLIYCLRLVYSIIATPAHRVRNRHLMQTCPPMTNLKTMTLVKRFQQMELEPQMTMMTEMMVILVAASCPNSFATISNHSSTLAGTALAETLVSPSRMSHHKSFSCTFPTSSIGSDYRSLCQSTELRLECPHSPP